MNTRKYDTDTRKKMKRAQRTPAYRASQKTAAAERTALQATLTERNALIAKMRKALSTIKAAGYKHSDVDYASLGVE